MQDSLTEGNESKLVSLKVRVEVRRKEKVKERVKEKAKARITLTKLQMIQR